MKRIICFAAVLCCLALTACNSASIGIIGGADGPTDVYVNGGNDDNAEKYLQKHYVSNLPVLDMNIERTFTSDDRTLIMDDTVENELELMIYEFYHNMTSGSFEKMKDVISDNSLLMAVGNEEKNFADGIYYSQIYIDELELLDKDDLEDISDKEKQTIAEMLKNSDTDKFGIVEIETEIKFNGKMRDLAPQVGEGEVTRYYLIGIKNGEYKILDVYWEDFLDD